MSTVDRARQQSWSELLIQMFVLPVNGMYAGIDWMRRAVDAGRQASERGIEAAARGAAPWTEQPASAWSAARHNLEGRGMDRDLSGSDLKVVRYRIIFTKRDLEHMFQQGEELVPYPAVAAAWAGRKTDTVVQGLATGKIPRPQKWVDNGYPEGGGSTIPEEDADRYLVCSFEVVDRIERENAEYDRDKVKYLRRISSKIG